MGAGTAGAFASGTMRTISFISRLLNFIQAARTALNTYLGLVALIAPDLINSCVFKLIYIFYREVGEDDWFYIPRGCGNSYDGFVERIVDPNGSGGAANGVAG